MLVGTGGDETIFIVKAINTCSVSPDFSSDNMPYGIHILSQKLL